MPLRVVSLPLDYEDVDFDAVLDLAAPNIQPRGGLSDNDQEPGGRGRHSSRNRTGQGLGSTDLPVQRRQPRRAQSRLVVPLEQPEASSSDGKEPVRGSDADGLRAIRKNNRRTQQKFRDRQRNHKLAVSESRAEELQRALDRLKLERSAVAKNQRLQWGLGKFSRKRLSAVAERAPALVLLPPTSA
ncbi:hypothetical protein COCSUDRAFT_55476 [Coccomyxa subellipsoidea C-169]|uniref:BZIP domain-containing protein n=1 Tax=Coccomyxa subellipsoidea (strain C-169) TaxID=574566 RepID=I0ZA00_COCSC|nr:hypothetical protein COCSUDRAFT_55476 [Coccomyxa subellipsoidea C-169]EIE27469.1 hypothetical protein COCSUDRAFT_55476 [Coccomyxa subellipsoidea C-169]|eukprot:XP_005652013.1 hypothetical protein COCSUDRAFT_55476 [Coccomyxa subellipsoidea C-169]